MKTVFYVILVAALQVTICTAQSTNGSVMDSTEFGESVHGVQLSISLTNNIISTDSMLTIYARVKNSSTNIIYIGESSPESDFIVLLKDDSGKVYQLTQRPWVSTLNTITTLDSGTSRDWVMHLTVSSYYDPPGIIPTKTGVPPGGYMLQAKRHFSLSKNNVKFESVESNLLKVQIK